MEAGTRVLAAYKTGEYIGEVVEVTPRKAAVKVLAVVKHPDQGDLHQPTMADVAFFHQRRALSEGEIALMPLESVRSFAGNVPDYKSSLRDAIRREMDALQGFVRYAERSLEELRQLKKDYFPEE
ncbi:kinase-associated lipoprotein B [Paenibacillus sp. CC-CFT747]|nr:kinase-associated lipoprotein B [Paenibacillus sp. CC-CFT747]